MEIIAHRGASHDAPENTLAAARLAWEQGADALECDVHLTADGRLAVIHDADLRRVGGHEHEVRASRLADLQRFDVGRWKSPAFAGEKIPALDDLLASVPAGKRLFIEVKSGPEAIAELVRCIGRGRVAPQHVVVISFDLAVVRAAKNSLPASEACWIVERESSRASRIEEVVGAARAAKLDGLDLAADWAAGAEVVSHVRAAGLKAYVWTVDDPAAAKNFVKCGIDGLTTNRPAWLRDQLLRA